MKTVELNLITTAKSKYNHSGATVNTWFSGDRLKMIETCSIA